MFSLSAPAKFACCSSKLQLEDFTLVSQNFSFNKTIEKNVLND